MNIYFYIFSIFLITLLNNFKLSSKEKQDFSDRLKSLVGEFIIGTATLKDFEDLKEEINNKLNTMGSTEYQTNTAQLETMVNDNEKDIKNEFLLTTNGYFHAVGKSFSSEAVLTNLNTEINSLNAEITDLRKVVYDGSVNTRKLLVELRRKECVLEVLKENKKNIELSKSYSERDIKNDKKIDKYDSQIISKKAALNSINGVQNKRAKKHAEKLQEQIIKLQNKRGKIMQKQMKVANKQLVSIYKKNKKMSNKNGFVQATSEMREYRDHKLNDYYNNLENKLEKQNEQYNTAIQNKKYISSTKLLLSKTASYQNLKILSNYTKLLKLKDGKIDGFRKLPENVNELLRQKIQQLNPLNNIPLTTARSM